MELQGHSFDAQQRLRHLAVQADAAGKQTADWASLWRQLIIGELSILDHFSSSERHYLTLVSAAAEADARKLTTRQLQLLQRQLLGQPQKGVAIDCQLSASTVAGSLTESLRLLGLNVSASRAPVLLSLMLHAHLGHAPVGSGRESFATDAGRALRVASIARLEDALEGRLSPAEHAVVRFRADGKSHAEIAQLRKTSRRTIANQLASASRKLGVSGRCELVSYLSRVATSTPERVLASA